MNMKWILVCFVLMVGSTAGLSQNSSFSTNLNAGINFPILDNGKGVHFGLNPYIRLWEKFGLEGQLSYGFTRINSSFLSGKKGYYHALNSLIGGRVYFNSETRNLRPYINLMVGGTYVKESSNLSDRASEFNLGVSVGSFIEFYRFMVGVSFDSPKNFTLKTGYTFSYN